MSNTNQEFLSAESSEISESVRDVIMGRSPGSNKRPQKTRFTKNSSSSDVFYSALDTTQSRRNNADMPKEAKDSNKEHDFIQQTSSTGNIRRSPSHKNVQRTPSPRVARTPSPRVGRNPSPRLGRTPSPRVGRTPSPRVSRTGSDQHTRTRPKSPGRNQSPRRELFRQDTSRHENSIRHESPIRHESSIRHESPIRHESSIRHESPIRHDNKRMTQVESEYRPRSESDYRQTQNVAIQTTSRTPAPHGGCPLCHRPFKCCETEYGSTSTPRSCCCRTCETSDSSSGSDLSLSYQNHDEYLRLLDELEKKLIARNRERVRRTRLEFERRSRQNQNLDRPVCDYEDDDGSATILERFRLPKSPRRTPRCCCGGVNSDIMQNEKRWQEVELDCVGNGNMKGLHKSHWKMDPRTGEWVKVACFQQGDRCQILKSPMPPLEFGGSSRRRRCCCQKHRR